ncbi:MAG: hypothetical protein EON49_16955 [Acidovorax sp.]|nr:MAG: hypothetical protein EON49_16955 [Acidovorax sp.]
MLQRHDLYFLLYPPAHLAAMLAQLMHRMGLLPWADYGNVGNALAAEPFDISFNLVQAFHRGGGKGMAQLAGSAAGLRGVRNFEHCLAATMRRMGCADSQIRRSFNPHITLNYCYDHTIRSAIAPVAWRVTQFALVDSLYGKGQHDVVARWPLVSRQQVLGDW